MSAMINSASQSAIGASISVSNSDPAPSRPVQSNAQIPLCWRTALIQLPIHPLAPARVIADEADDNRRAVYLCPNHSLDVRAGFTLQRLSQAAVVEINIDQDRQRAF